VLRIVGGHLGSRQVARVVYGTIIGLAVIVALEDHPPSAGVVAGTLLGTAVAVGLAELYSDVVGIETRMRRPVRSAEVRNAMDDVLAVAFAIAFPIVFFLLAAAHVIEEDTAFTIAKWSGVGLLGFYGFCAARLSGKGLSTSALRAIAVGLVGALLVALKALLH
jgi:VIT1/CCC1 family predicted Fe2+/Mn2+ transporter